MSRDNIPDPTPKRTPKGVPKKKRSKPTASTAIGVRHASASSGSSSATKRRLKQRREILKAHLFITEVGVGEPSLAALKSVRIGTGSGIKSREPSAKWWFDTFLSYYTASLKPTQLDIAKGTITGVPVRAILSLQDRWHLFSDEEVGTVVGLSPRTIARYRGEPNKSLDPPQADRVYRLARMQALAEDVLESQEGASNWLRRPQPGLGGEIPLDLLATEVGTREVELLLNRIERSVGA